MKRRLWSTVMAMGFALGIAGFSASASAEDCYTCTSASTGKCQGMMYCMGTEAECKAAGCVLGSSSKTSCPTSANYKAKTCKP